MASMVTFGGQTIPGGGTGLQVNPVAAKDCLPCSTLRTALTQCGTCGAPPGTNCPSNESPPPCTAQQVIDPQTGCCMPVSAPAACPAGDVAATQGSCPANFFPDPTAPGCCAPVKTISCPPGDVLALAAGCPGGFEPDPTAPGCCRPIVIIGHQGGCPSNEHPTPCLANEVIDPATGCCVTAITGGGQGGCRSGEHPPPCGPTEFINTDDGCCEPGLPGPQGGCPTGEHTPPCQIGETIDPATGCCISAVVPGPQQGCTGVCANCGGCPPNCCSGGLQGPGPQGGGGGGGMGGGGQGTQPMPAPKKSPIEACFICPGGEADYQAAIAGQPNGCYLASIFALQAGQALPPPEIYVPGMFASAGA